MALKLVRKPPIGIPRSDRFKVTLNGAHTTKQKISMLLQAKFFLHEQGIDNVGITDVYFPLIDADGHPLTHFWRWQGDLRLPPAHRKPVPLRG